MEKSDKKIFDNGVWWRTSVISAVIEWAHRRPDKVEPWYRMYQINPEAEEGQAEAVSRLKDPLWIEIRTHHLRRLLSLGDDEELPSYTPAFNALMKKKGVNMVRTCTPQAHMRRKAEVTQKAATAVLAMQAEGVDLQVPPTYPV